MSRFTNKINIYPRLVALPEIAYRDYDGYNYYNLGGTLSNVLGGVNSIAGGFMGAAKIADTSGIEADLKNKENVNASTTSDLINTWGNHTANRIISHKDLHGGFNIGNAINSVAGGAMSGAQLGGPIGGIIGGGLGLLSSALGSIVGNNKAKREAERLNDLGYMADLNFHKRMSANALNLDAMNDDRLSANFFGNGGYVPSPQLRDFLKTKEAFVPHVYDDTVGKKRITSRSQLRSKGTATIGYGFTDRDLVNYYLSTGKTMTKEEADRRLDKELAIRVAELERLPNFYKYKDSTKDALMAILYNMGMGNMKARKDLMMALETGSDDIVLGAIHRLKGKAKDPVLNDALAKRYQETAEFAGYVPYPARVSDNSTPHPAAVLQNPQPINPFTAFMQNSQTQTPTPAEAQVPLYKTYNMPGFTSTKEGALINNLLKMNLSDIYGQSFE